MVELQVAEISCANVPPGLWAVHITARPAHHPLVLFKAFTPSSIRPALHSTCSGSASMHVSHGFLGICGMERMSRAIPVRKRRTKPLQAQAKDQE